MGQTETWGYCHPRPTVSEGVLANYQPREDTNVSRLRLELTILCTVCAKFFSRIFSRRVLRGRAPQKNTWNSSGGIIIYFVIGLKPETYVWNFKSACFIELAKLS